LQEIAESQLDALILVGGGRMNGIGFDQAVELARHIALVADQVGLVSAGRFAIEIGNEPDNSLAAYQQDPALFARLVRRSAEDIWAVVPQAIVISGGVMNTTMKGLDYLRRASQAGFPDGCRIGYHCYHTTSTPDTPHDGFSSRQGEFDRLADIVSGRPMWCTEVGWHTFPSRIPGRFFPFRPPRTVQFNDDQVADFTERELRLHHIAGAVCAAVFQLNDQDPPSSFEHRHGIRRTDGTAKPVATRLRDIAPSLA
jgi:hypothetical protein